MNHNDLEDLMLEDWTWRKTEISTLILLAEDSKEEVVLKSIILLLYAHWEGYIKKCSKLYLKFISDSDFKLSDLTENFKAAALKGVTKVCLEAKDSLTLQNEIAYIKKFNRVEFKKLSDFIIIDLEDEKENSIIDTHMNLTPLVFKNILEVIGLNYQSQYEAREKYIDSHLLANRNSIGHGNKFDKKKTDFNLEINNIKKLRDIMISVIENFQQELIEYSREKYFLKANHENLAIFLKLKEEELSLLFKEIESRYD